MCDVLPTLFNILPLISESVNWLWPQVTLYFLWFQGQQCFFGYPFDPSLPREISLKHSSECLHSILVILFCSISLTNAHPLLANIHSQNLIFLFVEYLLVCDNISSCSYTVYSRRLQGSLCLSMDATPESEHVLLHSCQFLYVNYPPDISSI